MDAVRALKLGSALMALGVMHVSCGGEVGSGSAAGGSGGVAESRGGETSAGAGAAGEALGGLGGGATGEAGSKPGSAGAGGVSGSGDEELGGAGSHQNGPACADAQDRAHCDYWSDGPCVFEDEVCLCDVSDFSGGFDVFSWSCFPRGCPATPPGPQRCTGTTPGVTELECEYGDRVCTCDAPLGELGSWSCPMVCPSARPSEHEPCAPSALTPNSPDDRCTYDSGTCQCVYVNPHAFAAEWRCVDN